MTKQGDELSTALHQAIGANTRTILARIVAIDHLDRNRVTAFSEMFGNLEVVVGNIRWLRINDVIVILRAAPEEKYQPNLYLGWAGNLADNTPGTPTLLNTGTTALVTDLPETARVGDLRIVGGTIDLTGQLVGATTYVYAQISEGTYQWVSIGSSTGGGGQASLGWYVDGSIVAGAGKGPVYSIQTATSVVSFVANAKVPDGAGNDATFDILTSTDRSTWTSIFSVLPVLDAATGLSTAGTLAAPALTVGMYVRLDVPTYAGSTVTDVTIDLFLGG